ncbi:hypothetical protein J5W80_05510 [Akkermansia muciniphila]|uniref:hypothetical protein n=1 Tax=Akkermansia muciniphila TaxID=239935 RepID=UPI001C05F496|nr:hypothetical protein [Akkermansia muciniphila]QWP30291.1 hypothetical protein J5W80_05510 [Akkermansia muciniphila]
MPGRLAASSRSAAQGIHSEAFHAFPTKLEQDSPVCQMFKGEANRIAADAYMQNIPDLPAKAGDIVFRHDKTWIKYVSRISSDYMVKE